MDSSVKASDLTVAVLLTFEAQMLDVSPIDLFGMLDKEYLSVGLPAPIVKLGLSVKIYYIGNHDFQQKLTGQAKIFTNSTLDDEAVQPGKIDILLIPGPPPRLKLDQQTLDFVAAHAQSNTTIMTVCTGCYVAAQAGILRGRTASAPRALVPQLQKEYPEVTWNNKRRFVKDTKVFGGKAAKELWTSGGVTNGLEMVAAYIKEKYPGPLGDTVCAMADVGEKGEFYDSHAIVETAWWIGQILRALLFGQKR